MGKRFPIVDWLFSYDRKHLADDISAGLTVGVMLIPQGMAYAILAGLPPIYGLYASTIPLIIYAILGTSRQLSVGPVAMVALLIASGVSQLAEIGSSAYIAFAILLAIMVGVIQFSMGILKLGFVVNFLAHPVIAGFTSAAAIIIGFSQLKHLLGINIPNGKVHETIISIAHQFSEINAYSLMLGIGAIVLLILFKSISKRIPGPLIIVVLGIGLVYGLSLFNNGVQIVRDVPGGLPAFEIPNIDMKGIKVLFPIALTIAFIGFMESIAVAKAIQAKHKNYEIDANQELISLGVANIVGSFFKAFPVTGGFSRTAVNDQSGAKTGLASLISAAVVIITLIFLTDYFYYLPNTILAAIILVAVYGLIDFKEALHLWKVDKLDFMLFMITALGTLSIGIEEGILIGVALSIGALVYRTSYPHMAELGEIDHTGIYRNIKRFENASVRKGTSIIRIDAPLFFGNIIFFKEKLSELTSKNTDLKNLIIHAGSITGMDSSAVNTLGDICKDYHSRGVRVLFTNLIGPVRDILQKNGLVDSIGPDNFFLKVEDAVAHLAGKTGTHHKNIALQSNI